MVAAAGATRIRAHRPMCERSVNRVELQLPADRFPDGEPGDELKHFVYRLARQHPVEAHDLGSTVAGTEVAPAAAPGLGIELGLGQVFRAPQTMRPRQQRADIAGNPAIWL